MALAERDIPGDSTVTLAMLADEVIRQLAPIGKVMKWWRPSAAVPIPDGWAVCDGSPAGAHDFAGVGAFNLPDLRGLFADGAQDGADGSAGSPSVAPGIGGRSGANTVDDTHRHLVRHGHGISMTTGSFEAAHAVTGHSHSLSAHSHKVAMPSAMGPSSSAFPGQYFVLDPSNDLLDDSDTHFWKNATGNRHSIRLDPLASGDPETTYIQDSFSAESLDMYEQTSAGPSTANTANDVGTNTGVSIGGTHDHGGAGSTDAFTDFQGGIRDNRPAYVGMLRLMKLRHA